MPISAKNAVMILAVFVKKEMITS